MWWVWKWISPSECTCIYKIIYLLNLYRHGRDVLHPTRPLFYILLYHGIYISVIYRGYRSPRLWIFGREKHLYYIMYFVRFEHFRPSDFSNVMKTNIIYKRVDLYRRRRNRNIHYAALLYIIYYYTYGIDWWSCLVMEIVTGYTAVIPDKLITNVCVIRIYINLKTFHAIPAVFKMWKKN